MSASTVGDPLELSSTYFFVAASVLSLGAPTFVSFLSKILQFPSLVRVNPTPGAP